MSENLIWIGYRERDEKRLPRDELPTVIAMAETQAGIFEELLDLSELPETKIAGERLRSLHHTDLLTLCDALTVLVGDKFEVCAYPVRGALKVPRAN